MEEDRGAGILNMCPEEICARFNAVSHALHVGGVVGGREQGCGLQTDVEASELADLMDAIDGVGGSLNQAPKFSHLLIQSHQYLGLDSEVILWQTFKRLFSHLLIQSHQCLGLEPGVILWQTFKRFSWKRSKIKLFTCSKCIFFSTQICKLHDYKPENK